MLQLKKREVWMLLGVFILWRMLLFGLGYIADTIVRYQPSFPYADAVLMKYDLPRWLYSWGNFDGVHYLTIAEHGYKGTGLIQAFFPIYPLLVRILSLNPHSLFMTSLIISNIAVCASILLLYVITKELFSSSVAWRCCILLLLFPTSFYFGAVYNESLFLVLVLGSFWAAHKKKWLVTGILAGFASATRIVGIFLVAALVIGLIIEHFQDAQNHSKSSVINQLTNAWNRLINRENKSLGWLVVGGAGLCCYMLYLWSTYGDPLYFLHVQSEFGSGREEHIVLLPQTLWRAIKILLTAQYNIHYLTYIQEIFYTVLFMTVLLMGFRKKFQIPYAWTVFSLLAVLLPTTTGTLSSMPRYVLVAFPFFVILALQKLPQYIWISIYTVSTVLLLINTILFIQGYWIA